MSILIKERNNLGHLKTIHFKTTTPKMEDMKIKFSDLALFVGANGVGKTLVLKFIWWAGTVIKMSTMLDTTFSDKSGILEIANQVLHKTFDKPDFEGSIKTDYQGGSAKFTFEAGVVVDVDFTMPITTTEFEQPIFMSKDMRTFDQYKMYLKSRNLVGIPSDVKAKDMMKYQAEFSKLEDMYKLYDLMVAEKLIHVFREPYELPEHVIKAIQDFPGMEKYDIKTIEYAPDEFTFIWRDSKGDGTDISTMGAGEQSLLNMILTNAIST